MFPGEYQYTSKEDIRISGVVDTKAPLFFNAGMDSDQHAYIFPLKFYNQLKY